MAIVNGRETARRWRLALVGMTKQAAVLQFNSVPDAGEQLRQLATTITRTWAIWSAIPTAGPTTTILAGLYEFALKVDPNHGLTWQYYGLWQIVGQPRPNARKCRRPSVATGPFFLLRALNGWT